jgi:hypothetical protein
MDVASLAEYSLQPLSPHPLKGRTVLVSDAGPNGKRHIEFVKRNSHNFAIAVAVVLVTAGFEVILLFSNAATATQLLFIVAMLLVGVSGIWLRGELDGLLTSQLENQLETKLLSKFQSLQDSLDELLDKKLELYSFLRTGLNTEIRSLCHELIDGCRVGLTKITAQVSIGDSRDVVESNIVGTLKAHKTDSGNACWHNTGAASCLEVQ